MGGPGQGQGSFGGSEEGFGIGPDDAVDTSISQPAEAMETDPMAPDIEDSARVSMIKTLAPFSLDNPNRSLISRMAQITGPIGISLGLASALARGVTAPNDYSQLDTSVQTSPTTPSTGSGSGIATIQQYAPLYNPDTGNPTMDAYIRQLRINLGLPV